MMDKTFPPIVIPLHTDEHGTIRVSGTRITLETVINYYRQGESPEAIHEGFPTLPLTDIYAVIAYYLAHQAEVDAYLEQRTQAGQIIRAEWEALYPSKITRAELLTRLEAKKIPPKSE